MSAPPNNLPRQADWIRNQRRSALRELLRVAAQPGILSLAGGLPAAEFFPRVAYAAALARVLRTDPHALQYRPPFEPLKEHIAQIMQARGVRCRAEQILVTTGAQQAVDVLVRLLVNPGQRVLLEAVTYTGVQQALGPLRPEVVAVPTDLEDGIDVDAVERECTNGRRPALLYAIPDAHNPYGVNIPPHNRQRLVEIATRYEVPIIEDDAYGLLHHTDRHGNGAGFAPPLYAHNQDWVFYVGSFSKILAPSLRLGWIVAPEGLLSSLTVAKEATDLETSALTQRAVTTYLDEADFSVHLAQLRNAYGQRRDAMLEALGRFFPRTAHWTRPTGGMFVWVELPEPAETWGLLDVAVREYGVAFVPGGAFATDGKAGRSCLRLSFATCAPADITEAVRRLAKVVERRRVA